jgi:hypothetical protein
MGEFCRMPEYANARKIPISALVLGLAGLIPFIVCAASQWISMRPFTQADGLRMGLLYAAVILSFLGGIRWGMAVKILAVRRQAIDFAMSVLSSLVGWASLLVPPVLGLCLLISAFLLQSLWDVLSVEKGELPYWFGKFRMILTIGAVMSLTAMLVPLVFS